MASNKNKMEVPGFLAILISYLNFYDAEFTIHRLIWLLTIGIGYYALLLLWPRLEEKLPKINAFSLWRVVEGAAFLLGFYFIFRKNEGLHNTFVHGILGMNPANNIYGWIIPFASTTLIFALLLAAESTRAFLDRVGSNYLLIVAAQPLIGHLDKFWEGTYIPVQGLFRVLLAFTFVNVLAYWIRKVIKRDEFFRQILVLDNTIDQYVFLALFSAALFLMQLQNTYAIGLFTGEPLCSARPETRLTAAHRTGEELHPYQSTA